MKRELKNLRKAIQKGKEDPFLYKKEEMEFMERNYEKLSALYKQHQIQQKGGFGQYVR
jgi:hypothetical protein